MPWPTPIDRCHCVGQVRRRELIGGDEHRVDRDHRVLIAVDQQDRRRRARAHRARSPRPAAPAPTSRPEKPTIAAGARLRRKPTCSAIIAPWLKPHERQPAFVEPEPAQAPRRGRRRSPAWRPRRPCSRSSAERASSTAARGAEREPLPAHRRAGAELVRVRRDEGRVGQQRAPMLAELDQVVAVWRRSRAGTRRAAWRGRSWPPGAVRSVWRAWRRSSSVVRLV